MGKSRWVIAVTVLFLSFVLRFSICLGAVFAAQQSVLDLALAAFVACAFMALVFLVNGWGFTSIWLRWIWLAALAAALVFRGSLASRERIPYALTLTTLVCSALAAVGIWLLAGAIGARRHDAGVVDLAFPFSGGRFLVTDGGDGARSFLVNYPYGFGQHRWSGVGRSMRYAMDVVELGRFGRESRGFLPRRTTAYAIWDRALLAPCDGVVVHTEASVEDNTGFGSHRPYGLGNHVVIRTDDDTYVALGHIRKGTVAVWSGDRVRAGQEIG